MVRWHEVVKEFRKTYHLEDELVLDCVMSTVLSIRYPGDPIWMYLVGVPGSGKTKLINAYRDAEKFVKFIDDFGEKSLISHHLEKGGRIREEASLLPALDGKTLFIKDLTTLFSRHSATKESVYGTLRACYDGYYTRHSGVGETKHTSHFNMVLATTPEIDFEPTRTSLGERFLSYRFKRIRKSDDFAKMVLTPSEGTKSLQGAILGFLEGMQKQEPPPLIQSEMPVKAIRKAARFLAAVRGSVRRDRDGVVGVLGTEEKSRLLKQFQKIYTACLWLTSDHSRAEALVNRLAWDSGHPTRLGILDRLLSNGGYLSALDFADFGVSKETIRRALMDLHLLGIAEVGDVPRATVGRPRKGYRVCIGFVEDFSQLWQQEEGWFIGYRV